MPHSFLARPTRLVRKKSILLRGFLWKIASQRTRLPYLRNQSHLLLASTDTSLQVGWPDRYWSHVFPYRLRCRWSPDWKCSRRSLPFLRSKDIESYRPCLAAPRKACTDQMRRSCSSSVCFSLEQWHCDWRGASSDVCRFDCFHWHCRQEPSLCRSRVTRQVAAWSEAFLVAADSCLQQRPWTSGMTDRAWCCCPDFRQRVVFSYF